MTSFSYTQKESLEFRQYFITHETPNIWCVKIWIQFMDDAFFIVIFLFGTTGPYGNKTL